MYLKVGIIYIFKIFFIVFIGHSKFLTNYFKKEILCHIMRISSS